MSLSRACTHKPKPVLGRLREIPEIEVIDVEQICPFQRIWMHVEGSRWSSRRSDPERAESLIALLFLAGNGDTCFAWLFGPISKASVSQVNDALPETNSHLPVALL